MVKMIETNSLSLGNSFPTAISRVCCLLLTGMALVSIASAQTTAHSPDKATVMSAKQRTEAPQVRLRLMEEVSSASAKVGQLISLETVGSVNVDGSLLIAEGAPARAIVTTARRRGHNHRQGQLILTVESVDGANGRKLRVQAAKMQMGSGKGEPIFGPCTFPLPADPVGLFRKGNNVVISKGTELTASLALGEDLTVPAPGDARGKAHY